MTRVAFPAFLLFTLALPAAAQPDLKGQTLAATFAELLPKLDKDNAAQQRWQDICSRVGAPGNEASRAEAAALMAGKLGPATPTATRLWLLTQLERIGRGEAVDAVAAVLDDKDDRVREAAVRALANNPSPTATEKLVAALPAAPGAARIGMLNALGHRADPVATAAVAKELAAADAATAVAAARALGRIPGSDAVRALAAARLTAKGTFLRGAVSDAQLAHADRLLKAGKAAEAGAVYKELAAAGEPRPVRLAALRGSIQVAGDGAGEVILAVLAGDDAAAKAVAVGQIETLTAAALKPLAARLDTLPVPSRVAVVTAVAARGDRSQLPVALAAAKSPTPEVRQAGVLALGRLGDATAVEFLLDVMAGKDQLAGAAADSLVTLSATGVDEKLVAILDGESVAARATTLIGVLERRKAAVAVPAVLKRAGGADTQVRGAAFAALKTLAGPEHVPGMVAALLKTGKGGERDQAEQAVAAVAQLIPEREKRAAAVLAAVKDDLARTADLLPLAGRLGGSDALQLVRDSMSSPALRDAAVTALCNWPDDSANADLLALAERGTAAAEKVRAVQAITRVNSVLVDRTPQERLATLKVMTRAMELATRDDERRAILEGLGNVRHLDTLRYVVPYLDKPALAQAACKGVVELAHSRMLREPNREEFARALDRVIALCRDKALVERARQYRTSP